MTNYSYEAVRAAKKWLRARSGAWYGQRSPDRAENTRKDKELDKSFANGKLVRQELLGSEMRGAANRKTPPTPSPTHIQDDLLYNIELGYQ